MDLVEFLNKLDRRYIFLVLFILSFLPVIYPLGLPVPLSTETKESYDALEGLQPGDIIVITFDYSGGSAAELYPQNLVIMRHALKKGLRIVAVCFEVGGPVLANNCFDESGYSASKQYGVDYVNLGFIAGHETAMSAFARNPREILTTDYYGTSLSNMPLMGEVSSIESFKYLAFTTSTSQDHYIRQFSGYSTKVVGCIQSLYYSVMKVYMGAGQIEGFINGLRGSAEYELLTGDLGVGVISMDQASVTHLYAVLLLILGNIAFYISRTKGGNT